MTVHRIIFDRWSTLVLVDELRQLYNGLAGERTVFLPPLSAFSDFVRAEEEFAASEEGQAALADWVDSLSPMPTRNRLPSDYQQPESRIQRAASLAVALDEITVERAKTAAAFHQTSFEVVLLTAYVSVLEQLTGQNDNVIGVSVAQQPLKEMPWLVGSAENLLPLRIQSSSNASTATLLTLTEMAWKRAAEQTGVTYGKLLQEVQLPRTNEQAPLIETTFSINRPTNTEGFADMVVSYQPLAPTHTIFDLSWTVDQTAPHKVTVDYNSALFAENTILEWVQQFESALEAIALEPIGEVSATATNLGAATGKAEKHQLTNTGPVPAQWYQTNVHFPEDKTVVDLFSMQASDSPNSVAVVAEDRTKLFYKGLNKKSNRLAHYIQAQELAEGTLIGICMPRTADTLTAMLGVMKSGHGFVALDPQADTTQLEAIVEDAQLGMIITQGDSFSNLELSISEEIGIVFLDRHWLIMAHHSGEPINHARPETVAYVSYRADQTGTMLGTVIHHAALSNTLMSLMDNPGLTETDFVLNLTPLTQAVAVVDMLLPLLMGARLILASDVTIADVYRLRQVIEKAGITMMLASSEQWQQLLDSSWSGQMGLQMLCYGQPEQKLADQLLAKGDRLWLLWGSAETTGCGLLYQYQGGSSVPLGRPIANTQAFVLDDDLQELHIGQLGDLYFAGTGLAGGYVNNETLTNARFITDTKHAPTMFKTGLQAAWRPEGVLTITPDPAVIDEFIDAKDEQPMAESHAVEEVSLQFAPEKTQIILPMSQTEAVVADIWRDALGRQTIDANADFFSLGGHSMLVVRVLAKIEEKLGARLSLPQFLSAPTVFSLSQLIDSDT